MVKKILFFLSFFMLISNYVSARMITYRGGTALMSLNDRKTFSTFIHYSPSAFFSIGHLNEYKRKEKFWIQAVQATGLKRWNWDDAQSNAYLFAGPGIAFKTFVDPQVTRAAGFGGFSLDWEDRRFYVAFSGRGTYAKGLISEYEQKARLGVAPYIGEYGDLHTWVMIQADHSSKNPGMVTMTPLLRFFKGATLLELGADFKGRLLFNFVQVF